MHRLSYWSLFLLISAAYTFTKTHYLSANRTVLYDFLIANSHR